MWIDAHALVYLRSYGMGLVVPRHGKWSRRHGSLPSLSLFDLSSLSFFLSLPLNQASVGLMVWWRSRFDVADQGGAVVVDRWVAIVLLIVDWGGAVVGFL